MCANTFNDITFDSEIQISEMHFNKTIEHKDMYP